MTVVVGSPEHAEWIANNVVERRLVLAYKMAKYSPDKSNQNGAIIFRNGQFMSQGHNHFYHGIPPTDERPAKYERIVHAEMDACLKLAHIMDRVSSDTVMYCPWATCKQCAIAILGAGIPKLVIHYERCKAFMETRGGQQEENLENWQTDESADWLRDGGCTIEVYRGVVHTTVNVNINGRPWSPQTLEFVDA